MNKKAFLQQFLQKRQTTNRLRTLKGFTKVSSTEILWDGKRYVNFSSNDYLGLSHSSILINAANKACEEFGSGSTSSRLVCGNSANYAKLEEKLAVWKNTEDALVFNSGYQANSSILPAIANRYTDIFSDKLNHASIVDGIQLSRAKHCRYQHNDMQELKQLLAKSTANRKIIISETLFSMDGDIVNLKELASIAKEHNALLYIDDAHGSGICGPQGRGPAWEIMSDVDIYVGTFGKALGSFGAYCACSTEMKNYLINSARGLIYSTGLPPSVIAANIAAVATVQTMDKSREHLQKITTLLRSYIKKSRFKSVKSNSPIVPLIIGSEENTLKLSDHLLTRGIYSVAIRPPTIPEGTCRIRFTLSAEHTTSQISALIDILQSWEKDLDSEL